MSKPAPLPVDLESYQLAEHFLAGESCDSKHNRQELADAIQQAVEVWFEDASK